MSAQAFEITLARLYTDTEFREAFLESAEQALKGLNLTESEKADFQKIDRTGLILAARSFHQKRNRKFPNLRNGFAKQVHRWLRRFGRT